MRSLVILFVGCLPLSVLTVWSFVELGSVDDRLGSANPMPDVPAQTDLTAALRTQVEKEKPLVEGLAEVDLLSGEWPAGLREIPEQSSFKPLADHWPAWALAREMAAKFLQLERLIAATVPERLDQMPLEALGRAPQQLETWKRDCEALKQKFEELKNDYQRASARGTTEFLALVDRRIAHWDRRIQHCQHRYDAAALLSDARTAFAAAQYAQCASVCDRLLSSHTGIMEASVIEKVQILRQRASFWHDVQQLYSLLNERTTFQRQENLLEGFLNQYGDRDSRTPAQQRILEQCEQRLVEVKDQLKAEEKSRAAADRIRQLKDHPPDEFGERLRRMTAILDEYPTPAVQNMLRAIAFGWLTERLPVKHIREPRMLQEAEMPGDRVVRGYFKEVRDSDGSLLGYKCYPTFQQLLNPIADVGMYRKEEFLAPPGQSVPRRCVTQFEAARNRLLENPHHRSVWLELADLCESLEAELRQYRKKKGASRGDPDLSFEQEARFVRELLRGSAWSDLETLFGP